MIEHLVGYKVSVTIGRLWNSMSNGLVMRKVIKHEYTLKMTDPMACVPDQPPIY